MTRSYFDVNVWVNGLAAMLTDLPPRKPKLMAFNESDRMRTIRLPDDTVLPMIAKSMEAAMKDAQMADVCRACQELLEVSSNFYGVPQCGVRVLAARPLRVRENWSSELFGDYAPETMLIRVWMRTAVKKEVTSFGTFLSTLCHEFCHHLDLQQFKFPDSWPTRGFYELPVRSITMPGIQLLRNSCGCRFQADVGGLIRRARIVVRPKLECLCISCTMGE